MKRSACRLLFVLAVVTVILGVVLVMSFGRSAALTTPPNPNGYDDLLQAAQAVTGKIYDIHSIKSVFARWREFGRNAKLFVASLQPPAVLFVQFFDENHVVLNMGLGALRTTVAPQMGACSLDKWAVLSTSDVDLGNPVEIDGMAIIVALAMNQFRSGFEVLCCDACFIHAE